MSVNKSLNHVEIEAKWQKKWQESSLDVADIAGTKKPFYNLMMFPYPSAEGLHVGNMYAFTGSDIYGRFKRMQGYDVFEPIGLDGFGIHSENYALKVGRHPMDHATLTEKNFYNQLHKIGAMFDWTRTVETYNPDYYRWTQWLFVQMFKHGLAYRGKAEVNWCPSCKTVLADEQVLPASAKASAGTCERCGNTVEKRLLEQWFFKITAYAGKLLENVSGSDSIGVNLDWSNKVKVAQKNWIGKKEGINITYSIVDDADKVLGEVVCFTTRPDTNYGATFVVIASEHPLITQLNRVLKMEQRDIVRQYCDSTKRVSKEERVAIGRKKTGVATGLYCVNQLNNTKMPLYVSDFVLMDVGTGAVVGVPGHDMRDFDFAKAMKLPIVRVLKGIDGDTKAITKKEQVQEEEGIMINSGFLDGLDVHTATIKIMDHMEQKGWGERVTTYHLRDWLISRQRYWGPPIPMIHCKTCEKNQRGEQKNMPGWWTVPEDQLPVVLPRIEDYRPGDDGIAPLAKHKEFYEVDCPGCGAKAVRETDVSDTFLDSSWYFLRYPSVHSVIPASEPESSVQAKWIPGQARDDTKINLPWDPEITRRWLPVHMYTGGAEHSVLHLMYSRFVTMALKDWGYIDFEEPFAKFYAHGLVVKDGAKMSKSKGNVVNPDEYIKLYGADALRLYLMFMGPYDQGGDFRDSAMEGMHRWTNRVWRLEVKSEKQQITSALHKLIKKVTDDMEKRRYNTAIASMMEFTNLIAGEGGEIGKDQLKQFILLLAPFAPHAAEEMWSRLGGKFSVHRQAWPAFDESQMKEDSILVVVQVNGKLRDTLSMQQATSNKQLEVEKLASKSEKIAKYLAGQVVKKVIFVPGKIINFVI